MTMQEVLLSIRDIRKNFGEGDVLAGISLDVARGEFVTLLGASGCGKTTTLRIISGLEAADAGRVILNGQDITDLPPEKRPVNTVFQSYALFPHMNVEKNVAYGLKVKGVDKATIKSRVAEMLELVQMSDYAQRMPAQLSGGQRQRIAIARALALQPQLLLLDEPLGALDLQLRRQMQVELKRLQKKLGITFIYITHDQEEAVNMSDRICVMRDGRFEQIGTPEEIYDAPVTRYVAQFIGRSTILTGRVKSVDGATAVVEDENGTLTRPAPGSLWAKPARSACARSACAPRRSRLTASTCPAWCARRAMRAAAWRPTRRWRAAARPSPRARRAWPTQPGRAIPCTCTGIRRRRRS